MVRTIRYFNTERQAVTAKKKYKKYKPTKKHIWSVQGNSLVRIKKIKRRKKTCSAYKKLHRGFVAQ